jgi:hypothetical protein
MRELGRKVVGRAARGPGGRPVRALAITALLLAGAGDAPAQQTDVAGPPGSGRFGNTVTVLTTGRIVITDPFYDLPGAPPIADVGAVWLYDPETGSLLGPLVGSTANDNVGRGGVTALASGNYVVRSPGWDRGAQRNAGAVTWCSGVTGCTGPVSAQNSLLGPGLSAPVGRVVALDGGNYVVASPNWDNGEVTNAGAVTWCSGTTGCRGEITAANSLTSSRAFARIGSGGIVELSNGNYVVRSPLWDEVSFQPDAGATTWCSGTAPCTGLVSDANSLVGTSKGDGILSAVTPLPDGGYVVHGPRWDDGEIEDVGAATRCPATGCRGAINKENSLHGTGPSNHVGAAVVALPGGHYVVVSPGWDDGLGDFGRNRGAVTFCDGRAPCVGAVTAANSLIGEEGSPIPSEQTRAGSGGVTALADGSYAVSSPDWDDRPSPAASPRVDAGAVTWCSGTTGCVGTVVTRVNSLVGGTANDRVGTVVALAAGGYAVASPGWDGAAADTGAVTWCGGPTGCTGVVSAANSLVGARAGDRIGTVVPLANGHFVVASPDWDDGTRADAGAVTWCSGTAGCPATVSAAGSLVGATAGDRVGTAVALAGGGFVVASTGWDDGTRANAGAVTWCAGDAPCLGPISSGNSLVGTTAGDGVGAVTALDGGDYVVRSTAWDDGALVDVGAVTFGDGGSGTVGPITSANSVVGTAIRGGPGTNFAFDEVNRRLVVSRPSSNLVTLRLVPEPGATAAGAVALLALAALHRRSVLRAPLRGTDSPTA